MSKGVTFITGAGEGLGKATAFELARQGFAVVVGEIDPEKGLATEGELRLAGFEAVFVPLDATSEESVKAAIAVISEKFGYLSVLVNNVGNYQEQSFEQMSVTDWTNALNLNLTSLFLSTKYSLPLLEKASGAKVIVNLSSNLAKIAEPLAPAYCATKAGVDMLTRCLALEYAPRGIRVVAIAPGPVGRSEAQLNTVPADAEEEEMRQFNPLKRFATPEEVARFIAYIVSDNASYMTGCTVALDGGETANPSSWSVMKRIKDFGQL